MNNAHASDAIPSTYEVLEAMREAGGWFVRKRKYVRPALWRATGLSTFAPAKPKDVERWLPENYPRYERESKRYLRAGAEEALAEAKYHDYGLPVLDDDTLRLVS